MALANPSLFLYGFSANAGNAYIDFQNVSSGPVLTAIVPFGSYSFDDYVTAVQTAFSQADPSNTYTVTLNRNIAGGTQNRLTVTSSGTYFNLLFGSGVHTAASPASLWGFAAVDRTGATAYTGVSNAGSVLVTLMPAYNYVAPQRNKKTIGQVNKSANGTKEAVVFAQLIMWEAEYKYEPASSIDTFWQPLMDWMSQQQPIEFTPDYTMPSLYYAGTLDKTEEDGSGLAYQMKEMLPDFPGIFRTGKLTFLQSPTSPNYIP